MSKLMFKKIAAVAVAVTTLAVQSSALGDVQAASAVSLASLSVLPEPVATKLSEAALPPSALGVYVQRVSDGAVVLSHRADVPLQPASTLKVLTSIVVLERLGGAHRGRVELRTAGAVVGEKLRGDVALRGLASPDFDWRALQSMLQSLRFSGVTTIDGDLLLDRSFFEPARADVGVPPFDESPEFRYNMIPDALSLNSNLLQLEIASNDTAMRVNASPVLDRVSIDSEMKIVDKPCADWEDLWLLPVVKKTDDGRIRVTLQGEFPRNCPVATEINVLDRVDFADRLFRSLWAGLGGAWTGAAKDGAVPANSRVLAEHQSRTLGEFNRDILKRSDNPITRLMYLTLGAQATGSGSATPTNLRSAQVVRDWLRDMKIDDVGLVLDNGSGLSRSERISAITLAGVLRAAKGSRWAPEFLAGLPIVGVDGGMGKRLANTAAAGVGRVKTGGLRNVVSVAGYVPDVYGEMCVVVAILNDDRAKYAVGKPIVDAVMEWVTRVDSRAILTKK